LKATINKDNNGIDIEIKGESLFKCGKLFIEIK
jgi:hypothetical protein